MEFLDEITDLVNSGRFQEVIDRTDEFLDKNPQYKNVDYCHFSNPLEELLFDEYVGEIDSVKKLGLDEPLEEIYSIYAHACSMTGQREKAEEYLKIANRINPVSARVLMRLCEHYQTNHEEDKLKDLACDIFKYAYDPRLLTSNYFKVADYLYHSNRNMELYDHLMGFYMFLISGEEGKSVSADVNYLKENGIQVGANPEILMMLMYLSDVYTQRGMENSAQFFKDLFTELAEYTRYLNNL